MEIYSIIGYIIGYIIGFMLILIILILFGSKMGLDNYDEPHGEYYDDWDSNGSAYLAWSIGWFICVPFYLSFWLYSKSVILVEKLIKKYE
jgi:ABC-type antimicrobial peptide transport system permease subunit